MRKWMPLVWAAALLTALTGCGGTESTGPEPVDLEALYAGMAAACGWEEDYMTDIEGDFLESYYPGLGEIDTIQRIVRVPAMSSDVNEVVLLQCGTEEDAERAAAVLQARVDAQIDGGAWYAETREAWEKAAVLRQGTCAALLASGEFQEILEEQFNQQFS